jgi:adenosylcobinamide-GDP ribazoletransferase
MFRQFPSAWSDFLHAVQFLTQLPVNRWVDYDEAAIPRCTTYFPLVGAGIGLSASIVFGLSSGSLPLSLATLLAMATPVVLTGALHEDGLADAADGLGGHATRDRALEIMRDSRIGCYGAVALFFLLAFRFEALLALGSLLTFTRVVVAAAAVSRACAVALLSTSPNARLVSATSRPFGTGLPPNVLAICLSLTAVAAFLLLGCRIKPLILAAVATVLLRRLFMLRLGGITGDCLGATIVLTELIVLISATSR